MIIKNVSLETVCGITSKLPENAMPEIAFAGKSNVGKSSLINALMNRKALARTSAQPGKTQTINFYNINNTMYLVDLPGYGYAKVAQEVKEQWGKLIERYLHGSGQLRAVFLLIDIRHEPSANDKRMYEWIVYHGYDPIIIATKLDKINRSQVEKHLKMVRTGLHVKPGTAILPFSALTKQGRDEIWEQVEMLLADQEEPEVE
ncbi:MAG: YihA family ribosome biogenesis GTP-binding protein [Lachnospiraceae bacterium]|jgi:ribosome biogenesis GTP-binding protein YsxC/EngB|uniref:ribosome biogenesis GTP-binding protein YihA/YsxC n=1 Tax=Candidatus Merdisoma sp. JLR.KK006 TaxID=3112626 RepID=UPI002FF1F877|nr:YihA family ribosome biogenesis GTP-binding protein [Lachnospiraceae bacterium]